VVSCGCSGPACVDQCVGSRCINDPVESGQHGRSSTAVTVGFHGRSSTAITVGFHGRSGTAVAVGFNGGASTAITLGLRVVDLRY
jgi:hypothetical protein